MVKERNTTRLDFNYTLPNLSLVRLKSGYESPNDIYVIIDAYREDSVLKYLVFSYRMRPRWVGWFGINIVYVDNTDES